MSDEQNDETPLLAPDQHGDVRLGSSPLLKWCCSGFSACYLAIYNRMTIRNWGRVLQGVGVLGVALTSLFYDDTVQALGVGIVGSAYIVINTSTSNPDFNRLLFSLSQLSLTEVICYA